VTQKLLYPLRDFSLGLNDKDDPALIPDNALTDVQNAIIGRGFIAKRDGYQKYNTAPLPGPASKLYTMYKNNGTNEFLAVSNLALYKDTAGVYAPVPFSGITTLTSNAVSMLTYKDRTLADVALIADGGKLKVYNGTNVQIVPTYTPTTGEATDPGSNDLVNLTNFRSIAIKQDRIFALGHATVKNRLSFCHHDPIKGYAMFDYWPATFFFDLVSEQNDESLMLRTFRNAIIVFNRRSMWCLTGDGRTINDYDLRRINVPSGCIAPESVAYVGNDLFYLSDDGVYRLYSTDRDYISADLVSVVQSGKSITGSVETALKGISLADKAKAVGEYFDNKYFLSFPSGLTLVYDTILRCWTKYTNVQANDFIERDGSLYFSSANGYVYVFTPGTYNDDGQAIPFLMKTKNTEFGYDAQVKKYRTLKIGAKQFESQSSVFSLDAVIDDIVIHIDDITTDESGVWDEGNWDAVTWDFKNVVLKNAKLRKKGYNIQYLITNEIIDQPLVIYRLEQVFKIKPLKG
jgi:hypothetical protein